MKQPLFKFGDKVTIIRTDNQILINRIDARGGRYLYQDAYLENELELYQEPKKKKLYAYGTETHFKIEFYDRKLDRVNGLVRKSEYDIEYPEDKEDV